MTALLVAALLALQAPAAPAPKDEAAALPPASEVLARYRKAIGGEAAIRKHKSRIVTGRFEIPAQGINGRLEVMAAAPDRMRMSVDLPGLGLTQRGYDGTVGWSIDPAGPRLLEGRELDELRHSADFYDDLHDRSRYRSIEVLSKGLFDGRECYKVKLVRTTGLELTEYFDAGTGLLAGVVMDATSPMGTINLTTIVDDYKDFGGVKMPARTRQKMMGLESVITLEKVDHAPLPADAFDLPAPIAALVKQRQ